MTNPAQNEEQQSALEQFGINLTERANIVVTDSGKEIYRTENFGKAAPPKGPKGSLVAQ